MPLSFLNNKIDTYVNSTVNFDIVCAATAIKELCQARDIGDTQLFNRQELTIMIIYILFNASKSLLLWFVLYWTRRNTDLIVDVHLFTQKLW